MGGPQALSSHDGGLQKVIHHSRAPGNSGFEMGGGGRRRWQGAGAWPGPARLAQPPVSRPRPGLGPGDPGCGSALPTRPAGGPLPVYPPLFALPELRRQTHTPFRAPCTPVLHCLPRPGFPPGREARAPRSFSPLVHPAATQCLLGKATQHAGNSGTLRLSRKQNPVGKILKSTSPTDIKTHSADPELGAP